jgi:hypothetical protein
MSLNNEKPLVVTLTKLGERFSLKFDYDEELRKFIKSFDRVYFDREHKEWTLPNNVRKDIFEYLNSRKAKVVTKNRENEAKIEINEDTICLSFRQYVDIWQPYRRIQGAKYDKIASKLIYPRSSLSN